MPTINSTSHETINEESIFGCFAAAQKGEKLEQTAESFVDVEEYENQVMYPEFARWARAAGYPEVSELFLKVAGEEKLHSVWLRSLYQEMGTPPEGNDTARAKATIQVIKKNCDKLIAKNPKVVMENALKVAIRVEQREYQQIYPQFRDQALAQNNKKAADVYQRVIDSEREHATWFENMLAKVRHEESLAIA